MISFIKKNNRYILIFAMIFIIMNFCCCVNQFDDPLNNYAFSSAIANGRIPYLDFNTISTPIYIFYCSIGLHLFNDFSMFILEQSLLVTLTFYFLYKIFEEKSYLFILLSLALGFTNIIGTYNYACFFMIVVLYYLEKKFPKKDYLIGFSIALAILSKHTVGAFLILPSLIFYYKDIKKIGKRFIGFIIPIAIFTLYLLYNKAFFSFFDLCILGLVDFSSNNGATAGKINYLFVILTLIIFIISIIIVLKNKKEIVNYYLVFGILFAVPLFDIAHFIMYFNCFFLMLIPYLKYNKNIKLIIIISFIFILGIAIFNKDVTFTKKMKHFRFSRNYKITYYKNQKYNKYINKFNNPLVISYYNIKYSLENDKDINWFSVPMYGNFGSKGCDYMIDKIKNMHNQVFIVSMNDHNSNFKYDQFAKEISSYIIKHYKKIDSKYEFEVYYKE